MIGAILGDIIGSPYEFDRGNKSKDFPLFSRKSTYTDDSVMTLAVGLTFLDAQPSASDDWILRILANRMRQFGKMDDEQAPPIGTKGTVRGVDDTASIMVRWDTGSGLNVVYGVDCCRKLDAVQITCYDKTEIWDSRKEAADFYLRAIAGSEGSECERYTKIYTELLMGKEVCNDEY